MRHRQRQPSRSGARRSGAKNGGPAKHPHTQARRCVAHKSNGEPCQKFAIKGATVCKFHGGATRHVKNAARVRLENAANLMAKQLLGIALTADSEAVKLSAIKDALDRGGLKAPAEVVLSQGEPKPYEAVFDGIYNGPRAGAADVERSPATAFADEAASGSLSDHQTHADSVHIDAETAEDDASDADMRPQCARRVRPRHITGDEALAVAASLRREQLALESPHKGYRRP